MNLNNYNSHEVETQTEGKLYDKDAEEALLGFVLINPQTYPTIDLQLDDFKFYQSRWIWNAIGALVADDIGVDNITLADRLQIDGHLDEIGGVSYIGKLSGLETSYVGNPHDYEAIIKRYARDRKDLILAGRLANHEDITADLQDLKTAQADEHKFLTGADIMDMTFTEPVWIVPGLIPAGMTILAGRPKIGKSYLALQIAGAIAAGGKVFGKDIPQGKVLYLALEDGAKRIDRRMKEQMWTREMASNVTFVTYSMFVKHIGFLHKSGSAVLQAMIENEGYKLVVTDIMAKAFMGIKDMNNGQEVVEALSPIQELSLKLDMGILILDQHGKMTRGNPIDDIMSSSQKAAVTDTAMGLYHDKNSKTYSLTAQGRDLDGDIALDVKRDYLTHTWQLAYDADHPQYTERKQQVLDYLGTGEKARLSELLDFLEIPASQKTSLWRDMQALVLSGKVNFNEATHQYYIYT